MANLLFYGLYAILLYKLEYVQSCDYEFANLDSSLSVDWSTSIESVVYTVQVSKVPENVITTDVLIQIDPPSPKFKLKESSICQVMVKACLEHGTSYDVAVKIINDTRCAPGRLSITTVSATPQFNIATTSFTAIPDENPFNLFTEVFILEILNDYAFGGCGAFICTAHCNNDANQNYLVDVDTKVVSAKKSVITLDFLYNIEVTCFDAIDGTFVIDDHRFNAGVTFVLTMPTPEPTTATTCTSTTMNTATTEQTAGTTSASTTTKTASSEQTTITASKSTSVKTTTSESASATAISGSFLTTAPGVSSKQVNTGFFDKPENIVALVLSAAALICLTEFGIGYVIYKKEEKDMHKHFGIRPHTL